MDNSCNIVIDNDRNGELCRHDDVSTTEERSFDLRKNLRTILETPEKLLHHAKRRAKRYTARKDMNKAVDELIKCIAWVRIIYGDGHWRIAQAEIALAEAYFNLKNFHQQAEEHAELAKEIVFALDHGPRSNDKQTEILRVLIRSCLILGRVSTMHSKLSLAEQNLFQAQHLFKEYSKNETKLNRCVELQVKILTAVARLHCVKIQFSRATLTWQKVINVAIGFYGSDAKELVAVYTHYGDFLSQQLRHYEKAADQFKKAHYIATIQYGENAFEALEAEFNLAKMFVNLNSKQFLSWAEQHLRHVISNTTTDDEQGVALHLKAEEQWIPLLLLANKEIDAVNHLKSTLKMKIERYGEFSKKTIAAHKMLASLYLLLDRPESAAKFMRECFNLENIVLGRDHSTTKETAFALNVILKNSDGTKKTKIRSE